MLCFSQHEDAASRVVAVVSVVVVVASPVVAGVMGSQFVAVGVGNVFL